MEATSLWHLPNNVAVRLFKLLNANDLRSVAHVNRTLYDLARDERLLRAWASGSMILAERMLHLHPNPPSVVVRCVCGMLDAASRAAERGPPATLVSILEYSAQREVQDWKERTPLSYAAEMGHVGAVSMLLDYGARHEPVDWTMRTPLSYAAEGGHTIVVRKLLAQGADAASEDRYMRSPLSYAVQNGHAATVRVLLDAGSNHRRKDVDNLTPLDHARATGCHEVVQLLLATEEKSDVDAVMTPAHNNAQSYCSSVTNMFGQSVFLSLSLPLSLCVCDC